MSTKHLIVAFAAAAMLLPVSAAAQSQSYGNMPGIAVAGSTSQANLPELAKEFINKHYKNVSISKVEREFLDNSYEVELANGVEIDFNAAGELTSIDTSDEGAPLSEKVVKDILPHKAYKELKKLQQEKNVDEIEFNQGHLYEVSARSVHEDKYSYDIQENVWRAL